MHLRILRPRPGSRSQPAKPAAAAPPEPHAADQPAAPAAAAPAAPAAAQPPTAEEQMVHLMTVMTAHLALTSTIGEALKKTQGDGPVRRVENTAKWPKDGSLGTLSQADRLASLGLWR